MPTLLEEVCTGGAGSGLLQDPEPHDSKQNLQILARLKIFQTSLVLSVPEGQLGGPNMRLLMEEKSKERKEKKAPRPPPA